MICIVLAVADIPYSDGGKDYDFHALCHQFITGLARAGVSLKSAQELARHSKPELTANTYTHLTIKAPAADVKKMAAIPAGQPEQLKATGSLGEHIVEQELLSGGISGYKPEVAESQSKMQKHKKTLENKAFPRVLSSDTDGTRTRNHRIDSPEGHKICVDIRGNSAASVERCTNGCTSDAVLEQLAGELNRKLSKAEVATLVRFLFEGG